METKEFLKSFFTNHWKYLSVNSACKLNLFDALSVEKKSSQLAKELNIKEEKLTFLLQSLVNIGFLDFNGGFYYLNQVSEYLVEKNPDSLKYACMNWANEHLIAWQQLDYSIKTGKSSFEKIYNLSYFDYLNNYPDKLHSYHKAMYEYAIDDYKKLPEIINFDIHNSLIDVGGGYGALISIIKEKFTNVKCYLFDLEKVVQNVDNEKIIKLAGNFFKSIPNIADGIILARILHDWNTKLAKKILLNCFKALAPNGTLYIIENCSDKIETDLSLLSLNMTAICESNERSSYEYINLCEIIGFKFQKDIQLNKLQTILIFKK